MDCPSCGAESQLGSAQCWSCGASMLAPPAPPPEPSPPPPEPPPPPPRSFDAPPPPPSDWLPGAPLHGRGSEPDAPRRARKVHRNRAGFGCGATVVLVIVAGIGTAIFGAVRGLTHVAGEVVDAFDEGEQVEGEPLSLGRPVDQHLDDDDTAVHRLAGIEGRVTITVVGDEGFDPVLRVSRPGGEVVGENDDADGTDSRLALILSTTDDLRVEVREYSGDAGDYTVLVVRGDETVGISPIDGGRLAIRTEVAGTVGRNQATAYDFTGEGREVVVHVAGIDGFDPVVRVLDGNGRELGRNDDSEGSRDSRLPIVVDGASTVTVEVTGFGGSAGSFRVLIE